MIVVSFFAPRIDVWKCDYDALLKVLDASCKRLGLRHVCLSDSKRPNCETFICKDLPRNLMQAFLEAQAQWLEQATEPTLFVGADCVLTKDPSPVLIADIVGTIGPFADCPLNTGAIWVKEGPKCSNVWRAALARNPTNWGDDQRALYAAFQSSRGLDIKYVSCKEHNWAPETPNDRAGMPTVAHFRGNRKNWMPQWYDAYVVKGLPELKYQNAANTDGEAILEHMRLAAKRDLQWFRGLPPHDGELVIVGGAPSLKDNLLNIKNRKAKGAHVWAMNNAWRPLVNAGIRPHVIVMMDARPENVEFIKDGPSDCHYLIAAMCHPEVFDALGGRDTTVWFPDQGFGPERDVIAGDSRPTLLVGGGGTVGLRSLILGYISGFREMHLYGVDSSYAGDAHHAYPQALNDADNRYVVHAVGKQYICAGWMARQANEFQQDRQKLMARGCRIFAHGTGLIPDISRHLNQQDRRTHGRGKTFPRRGREDAYRPALGHFGQSEALR